MIGEGILRVMGVTARNFIGSYFEKDRLTIPCSRHAAHPEGTVASLASSEEMRRALEMASTAPTGAR